MINFFANTGKWDQLKNEIQQISKTELTISPQRILELMKQIEFAEKKTAQDLTEICMECRLHLFRGCNCEWGNTYRQLVLRGVDV